VYNNINRYLFPECIQKEVHIMSKLSNNICPVEYCRYVIDEQDEARVVEITEAFTAFSGYTNEDITNNKITQLMLIPEEDRQAYICILEDINKGIVPPFVEHRFLKKDGSSIRVLCFGDKYTSQDGRELTRITVCNVTDKEIIKQKYINTQSELDTLFENVPGGVAMYEIVGDQLVLLKANDEYYNIFGYNDPTEHPGYGGVPFRREEVLPLISDASTHMAHNTVYDQDVLFNNRNGKNIWLRLRSKFIGQTERGNYMIYVVFIDITAAKRAARDIENLNERMQIIAENTDEIYFSYDIEKDTMSLSNCINRFAEEDNKITDYVNGKKYSLFMHPDDQEAYLNKLMSAAQKPQRGNFQFRTSAFDDDFTWYKAPFVSVADDTGKIKEIYGRLYSIDHVEKLKHTIDSDKAEIERLSTTDAVTGLLTRKAFKERVQEIISKTYDPVCCYAVVYSDINDFSYVNDNFGFDSGNQMLHDVAVGISSSPIVLSACRIYSDFFVSLVKDVSRDAIITDIKRVNDNFTNDQKLKYPASDLHLSTGVYFMTGPDVDITIAIDNADLARRSVKGVKEIPCGIYSERMRKQRSHDQQIAAELKGALQAGQIELFLQPKFALDTREIIGAEALSRWRNTDGSYKLPYEFISVLERVGYIIDLDMYIYETLLKTMSRWKREGFTLFPISINFSRNHASRKDFVDRLTALCDFYSIDPSLIEIEITESSFMQDFNALYNDMKKLREYGFKIDIDDFGMGYSSLSVLLHAPVDIVKVDKVFIDNIANSPQARDYVNQICSLIDLTNKGIIFEGVETEAQAQILASSGHKMAQGWLFDKAISIPEFEKKYLRKPETAE